MREKTEKPTPKKLRDARKKGQVAKSKEIATCAIIVGLFAFLWFFAQYYFKHIGQMILMPAHFFEVSFEHALFLCSKVAIKNLLILTIPFAIVGVSIAVLSYLLQFGAIFSMDPVKPDFRKINPTEGFKRIFSLNNFSELIKSIIKIILLSAITYKVIKDTIPEFLLLPKSGVSAVLAILSLCLKKLVLYISSAYIIIAILDYFLQDYLFLKKMRMSKDEVKREYKEREGDPLLRHKRRQIHKELASDDMIAKIKSSTVIISDAKNLSVGIYYEIGKTKLPIISMYGRNVMAERIQKIAEEYDVPVIQNGPVAWDLHKKGKEKSYIPSELIQPVALILRDVIRPRK